MNAKLGFKTGAIFASLLKPFGLAEFFIGILLWAVIGFIVGITFPVVHGGEKNNSR